MSLTPALYVQCTLHTYAVLQRLSLLLFIQFTVYHNFSHKNRRKNINEFIIICHNRLSHPNRMRLKAAPHVIVANSQQQQQQQQHIVHFVGDKATCCSFSLKARNKWIKRKKNIRNNDQRFVIALSPCHHSFLCMCVRVVCYYFWYSHSIFVAIYILE